MGFAEWVSNSSIVFRENGIKAGIRYFLKGGYSGVWRKAGRYVNQGTPIYEKDWDVLIVLDACRADLFAEVADDYDYIESVDSTLSVGSRSNEWMRGNFGPEFEDQIAETAMITGNPFSAKVLNQSRFKLLDGVWKYAWDDELGTIPPQPITDRAIEVSRNHHPEKMILHYMQPHFPFIPYPDMHGGMALDDFANPAENDIWTELEQGNLTRQEVWNAYRANLRYVLNQLRCLLNNLDYNKTVITADHGNSLGKYGLYGHPEGVPLNCLREVPWVQTHSEESHTYEPSLEKRYPEDTPDEKLRDLGYL